MPGSALNHPGGDVWMPRPSPTSPGSAELWDQLDWEVGLTKLFTPSVHTFWSHLLVTPSAVHTFCSHLLSEECVRTARRARPRRAADPVHVLVEREQRESRS